MAAITLDGKALAVELEAELRERVARLRAHLAGPPPVLATILVGADPASATYVRMKGNACRRVGMESLPIALPAETTTEELLAVIDSLNDDPHVRGILLQHPVSAHINERACFDRIAPEKDVDGVTSLGFGRMSMKEPAFGSATPAGIMRLLRHHQIPLRGKRATVIGRSAILGRPMATMLDHADCTVTLCHRFTADLPRHLVDADIVVAALGRREFIRAGWLQDQVVIVDAGYHPPIDGAPAAGDVELSASLLARAAAYTPVPGGVGPMTIATLIAQTVESAEQVAMLEPALVRG
ncbi:tetrahydrofolate dehydrogenase/cyclohydrolase catalytic domain-containing protein [Acidipila sp. EB88]|uniref:tetrahydrofolate dehydrogenase/cyclohydrolase catalytic domain-containing protein n=1 Tax=Acidipila sp. EB88 TaxID=2305226 RepID=UPI000F5EA2A9|nr:tetrahydrofolate dehydrogenase/cyclohydrolase catalytic domain-containing protein [Acidipila sp. EB88]RRA48970.1 bifunctional 5,10-methylene-tetrahydrofolate dehydrogenase/5,10-methylene-tetrahydrofolate cyclohydrolase [Acidipila sp. EB88]